MKLRLSKRPFGGAMLLFTLDPEQFGPVNGLPLLVSSLILTNYILVELKHSVRAHQDVDFQEIQNITRMNPDELMNNEWWKRRFRHLMKKTLTFVPNFEAAEITPNTQRMFARRAKAFEASKNHISSCIARFNREHIPYTISNSEDFQQRVGSRADYVLANSNQLIQSMNKNLKEPPQLLFYEGAQFEATINGDG